MYKLKCGKIRPDQRRATVFGVCAHNNALFGFTQDQVFELNPLGEEIKRHTPSEGYNILSMDVSDRFFVYGGGEESKLGLNYVLVEER